jgi:hypothetical protein
MAWLLIDKLKTRLKETIHKAFSHRNYGSKFVVLGWVLDYRIYIKSEIWSHTTGGHLIQMLLMPIALWRERKWRAHNKSYCLIEVVTNVGLIVFLLSLENHFKILKINAFKYWWILATYLVCLRPVSCVPNVISVSGLYITDCSFSFL